MDLATHFLWMTLCVFYEASGEPFDGKKAVVHSILNRVSNRGLSVTEVVQERYQYSWYNEGASIRAIKRKHWLTLAICAQAVAEAYQEHLNGFNLGGADHYYAFKGKNKIDPPYWAPEMEFIDNVGNHKFLKDTKRKSPSYKRKE